MSDEPKPKIKGKHIVRVIFVTPVDAIDSEKAERAAERIHRQLKDAGLRPTKVEGVAVQDPVEG